MRSSFCKENIMRILTLYVAFLLFPSLNCMAFQAAPFKASKITVEYGQGRKAIFTLNTPAVPAFGDERYEIPAVIGVEFVFSNGKTAKISEEGLKGIEITDIHSTMIETGAEEGTWFLTTRIKNQEKVPNRIANDWVVFVFEGFQYKNRWLELNQERNAKITKAEQGGAGQPATRPESK